MEKQVEKMESGKFYEGESVSFSSKTGFQIHRKFKHELDSENQEGTPDGGWRPAIAYPFFVTEGLPIWKKSFEKYWRPKCGCGAIFANMQAYREHYVYWAVWENESGYIPKLLQKRTNDTLSALLKQIPAEHEEMVKARIKVAFGKEVQNG